MMEGWKVWVGTILAVATGVGMVCTGLLADPMDGAMILQGILVIAGAFGLVGVGHKVEKGFRMLRKTLQGGK